MGSVADKVLRGTRAPLLLLRPDVSPPQNPITHEPPGLYA
jgi:hypothetical protein